MKSYAKKPLITQLLVLATSTSWMMLCYPTVGHACAFVPTFTSSQPPPQQLSASKGFGAAPKKTNKPPNKKKLLKQLETTYGGTSPQDIARGTQQRMDQQLKLLPEHLQMALQLYQKLQPWRHRVQSMTPLQQAQSLLPSDLEGAQRAESELEQLLQQHDVTESDLHNVLQQLTWDASADAKAARSITGTMPPSIQRRVERACQVVAESVKDNGKCLDVGCGFGVLVPFLLKAGLAPHQIHGIDLSPEMIRNAELFHPEVSFEATDFFQYQQPPKEELLYNSILFCSSLHDLPDMMGGLEKASSLLAPNGTIVIVHAQGASHVAGQVRSNPVLVRRGLPTTEELLQHQALLLLQGIRMELLVEPAAAKSKLEDQKGYLAVLQKRGVDS
jgi:2-polyprenyl-3-methyl-5-hydroxy-6-metoxy-1,4-benzoquinol methylase